MQVQQNNQPSFGMALKVKKDAINVLDLYGLKNDFIAALPKLQKRAGNVDITALATKYKGMPAVKFIATPTNSLKMNNQITRDLYQKANKTGEAVLSYRDFTASSEFGKPFSFTKFIKKSKKNLIHNLKQNELPVSKRANEVAQVSSYIPVGRTPVPKKCYH